MDEAPTSKVNSVKNEAMDMFISLFHLGFITRLRKIIRAGSARITVAASSL